MTATPCPFCDLESDRAFLETDLVVGLWDKHPVSPGHALLVPRRHVASWFDATASEQRALVEGLEPAKAAILARYSPDGFNIGVNVGPAAGQTVFHLHVHLIPRYTGDSPDPRGGVRHVLPTRANYLSSDSETVADRSSLVRGEDDPLLPHLIEQLGRAAAVDLAVSFVQPSGIALLDAHLRDLLIRGGRLRVVTGDYLDITDPVALLRLLDLAALGQAELRIFESGASQTLESRPVAFHPKAYVFHHPDARCVAFVGSANVSESALLTGIEWNYRAVSSSDVDGLRDVRAAFDRLWAHPRTTTLTADWVDAYRARRRILRMEAEAAATPAEVLPPAVPHDVQVEALAALQASRQAGNRAGLVVLATGLGKTWLSAFDSNRPEFKRVLFVAHREEILAQAMHTYRRVRPGARFGLYTGDTKQADADVLFASIQTLGRQAHLGQFARDAFDYVVVDEFHHAAATTYRKLIEHFAPGFLLGLTATPERSDGGDLLALCQENLVYRCDVDRGIRLGLLCPFHYFGVPDDVDYANIPWRSSRFDEKALTDAVATRARALNALDQWKKRAGPGSRTIAFCVSQRHADFMAEFFREQGLRAASVHAGPTSAARAASLEALGAGHLDIVCAVDMFNEGVDLPALDTVIMLRPTESRIVWLQQFGRGLRVADGKERLTVVDYIGNHRTFLLKPQTLFNLGPGRAGIAAMLERYERGHLDLPPGCEVTYELGAIEILKALLPPSGQDEALRRYYEDFKLMHGVRPTASEAFHDGYNPRTGRKRYGTWFSLVAAMGDLDPSQADALKDHGPWLDALETTAMTKSYKMLVLLAMLNADRFPEEIPIGELADRFRDLATRTAALREDFEADLDSQWALRRLIERNPVDAWVGGKGTGDTAYFSYDAQVFRWLPSVPSGSRAALQELTRELVEWRLAEYLQRLQRGSDGTSFEGRVKQANGRPMVFLPDRASNPAIPNGITQVHAGDELFEADFGSVALNVMRRPNSDANELPAILREWFGHDAGQPGTHHVLKFSQREGVWSVAPVARRQLALVPWQSYLREKLPALFGGNPDDTTWMTGFLVRNGHMILLVTLDKRQHDSTFQYHDRFMTPDLFQWQSRNKTSQSDAAGQAIIRHREQGMLVHLFVRATKKLAGGRTAPFTYCGKVEFVKCEGDKPITVEWRLPEPVPQRLWAELRVPSPLA